MPSLIRGLPLSAFFLGAVLATAAAAITTAAEPLAWKFTPGAALRYRTTDAIDATLDLGPGGNETQHIARTVDSTWTVDSVNADGSAVATLQFERMQLEIKTADGQTIAFDTDSTDEPQSFAAMAAPLLREMTRAKIGVTMTPRGAITAVEVPETLVAALGASPGAELLGELATAEGVEKLIRRASVKLPEELVPDASWETVTTSDIPELGTQAIRTKYRYAGPKTVDGVNYESFTPTVVVEFADGPVGVKVTNQESSGEILFNRDAGRLESYALNHTLELAITRSGKTINQSIEQSSDMKWREAE